MLRDTCARGLNPGPLRHVAPPVAARFRTAGLGSNFLDDTPPSLDGSGNLIIPSRSANPKVAVTLAQTTNRCIAQISGRVVGSSYVLFYAPAYGDGSKAKA